MTVSVELDLNTIRCGNSEKVSVTHSLGDWQGRRFQVALFKNTVFEKVREVKFHELYKVAERLVEAADIPTQYKQVSAFINVLQEEEDNASIAYEQRAKDSPLYYILTKICRLVNLFYGEGSHQERLSGLLTRLAEKERGFAALATKAEPTPEEHYRLYRCDNTKINNLRAASNGSLSEATYELGHYYKRQKEDAFMISCWKEAADLNHLESIIALAEYYENPWKSHTKESDNGMFRYQEKTEAKIPGDYPESLRYWTMAFGHKGCTQTQKAQIEAKIKEIEPKVSSNQPT